MRIAVVADIHGNSFALEAVLEDIARQSVDEVVAAGDLVNIHPNARRSWDMLRGAGCRLLQGNHEYYLYSLDDPAAPELLRSERFRPAQWTAGLFSPAERALMRDLPWHYARPGLLVTHASERSLFDTITAATSDAELAEFFPHTDAGLIVRGHNHRWLERPWEGRTVLMVNACGLPFGEGPVAPYAVLTRRGGGWAYERRAVRYDHAAALAAMGEEYVRNVGPLGRIFRLELQTGRVQNQPFFGRYGPALEAGELTLEAAVEAFLAHP